MPRTRWKPFAYPALVAAACTVAPGGAFPGERTPPARVAEVLARCQACHSGAAPSGGVDLSTRANALKTKALSVDAPSSSRLIAETRAGKMPPGDPLPPADVAALEAWVASGAKWPAAPARPTPVRAGADFWSLRTVGNPAPPPVRRHDWPANPIDRFVLARLETAGLSPAPDADRRTLIRRATYDMLGLPPTPAEIDAYVSDKRPGAWERVVERLLASPHYGERWGRHWLDVVRFGESHGYEYDRVRDHAWRYRDWVVDALNADKPYDRFLAEQIAGDALPGAGGAGAVATGFLVCGPSDEAGKGAPGLLVRLRAREEEMEDMIGLVGQTALGLTINCARCHDHKFDPIPMTDYYRIKAALAGVQAGNRSVETDAERAARNRERAVLEAAVRSGAAAVAAIEEPIRRRFERQTAATSPRSSAPIPATTFDFEDGPVDRDRTTTGSLLGGARIESGRLVLPGRGAAMRTGAIPSTLRAKTLETWVVVGNRTTRGGSALTVQSADGVRFDGVVWAERQPDKWMAGSDGFVRTRDLDAPEERVLDGKPVQVVVAYHPDGTIACYRDGKPYAPPYKPSAAPVEFPAASSQFLFGHRHTGSEGWLDGAIEEARIYDRALSAEEVAAAFARKPASLPRERLLAELPPIERRRWADATARADAARAALRAHDDAHPGGAMAYAAVSTQPPAVQVLRRGDPTQPADPVVPGGLTALRALPADFGLDGAASDPERRIRLARWLVDPRNPLVARVMANRIWQGHFGRGLVGTPNDFGFNGERPSHPELLDWLARTFATPDSRGRGAWSMKRLHRLILTSRSYRMAGARNPKAERIDADNRLLWRMAPRRLEGEAFRDALLAVAGNLNPKQGGPGFRPFTVTNYGSDFYTLVDRDTPEFNRRSIYRMAVHSARSPLLEALDCPDPSTKTPRRTVTTTPIQALEMMNDRFVLRQADVLARRIDAYPSIVPGRTGRPAKSGATNLRVEMAWRLAYGRRPTSEEARRAEAHLARHSLASLCWTLFNSNEFLYVD